MKKKKGVKKLFTFLIIIALILIFGYFAYIQFLKWWQKEAQIAVKVGDDIITYEEIDNRIFLTVGIEGIYSPAYQEKYLVLKKSATDEIIRDSLVMRYAIMKGYKIDEKNLDNEEYVGNDRKRVKYVELIRKEIEEDVEKNLQEKDLKKYFNENKSEFILLKAQYIYIKSDKNDEKRKEKEDLIKEAYERIINGESFSKIVQKYSDIKDNDGLLDYFDIYKFSVVINDKIFNLNIGDVSEPITTLDGFYIFKILDKKEDFNEVKEKVKERFIYFETNRKLSELKEKLFEENQDIIIYGNKVEKFIDWFNKVFLGRGG